MDNSRQIPELQYMVVPEQYADRLDWYKRRCWSTRTLKRGEKVEFVDPSRTNYGGVGIVVTGRKLKPKTYGVTHVRKLDE